MIWGEAVRSAATGAQAEAIHEAEVRIEAVATCLAAIVLAGPDGPHDELLLPLVRLADSAGRFLERAARDDEP